MGCRSAVRIPASAWKGRDVVCHGCIVGVLAAGHGSGPKDSVKFVGSHTHTHTHTRVEGDLKSEQVTGSPTVGARMWLQRVLALVNLETGIIHPHV